MRSGAHDFGADIFADFGDDFFWTKKNRAQNQQFGHNFNVHERLDTRVTSQLFRFLDMIPWKCPLTQGCNTISSIILSVCTLTLNFLSEFCGHQWGSLHYASVNPQPESFTNNSLGLPHAHLSFPFSISLCRVCMFSVLPVWLPVLRVLCVLRSVLYS